MFLEVNATSKVDVLKTKIRDILPSLSKLSPAKLRLYKVDYPLDDEELQIVSKGLVSFNQMHGRRQVNSYFTENTREDYVDIIVKLSDPARTDV